MRLLVANLDAELALARAATPGPHPPLPAKIAGAVARASAWMALLGQPGDRLWTLAPIEAAAVARVAPEVMPVSGELADCGGDALLAWCETEAIAARRAQVPAAPAATPDPVPWIASLWHVAADPAVVARVNDRRLSARVAGELGCALPGSAVLSSVPQLEAHLRSAPLGAGEAWVAKAPLSAAGRERLRRRGRQLDGEARVRAERLLSRYGQLCFEPWVERTADLGRAGVIADHGVTLFSPHRMECNRAGVVQAVVVDDDGLSRSLGPAHRRQLDDAADAAIAALTEAGYRGAFALDAFLYRDAAGGIALQPLVEINARLSFGHLARAGKERTASAGFRLALAGPP